MRTVLTAALLGSLATAAPAAEENFDITPDFVSNIARGFGSALLQKTKSGQPVVLGRIDGQNYVIFLIDCEKKPSCAIVQFSTQFPGDKIDPAKINDWNRDKRFGRVAIGPDQKVWVSQPVVSGDGLPRQTLERYFGFWRLVMKELPPFIAAK